MRGPFRRIAELEQNHRQLVDLVSGLAAGQADLYAKLSKIKGDIERLQSVVMSLEGQVRRLSGVEDTMTKAAGETTLAIEKVMTEISLFRRSLGEYVPAVDFGIKGEE